MSNERSETKTTDHTAPAAEKRRKSIGHRPDVDLALSAGFTEDEVRSELADVRAWVNRSKDVGTIASLAMIVAGSVIMGLIHLPSLSGALRWPGITLLLTGVFYFILVLIINDGGLIGALLAWIVSTVSYGLISFLGTILYVWMYNVVAKRVGGIKIELS